VSGAENTVTDSPKVLIVDDERLVRWSLAEAFRSAGFTVLEAQDVQSGMDCLAAGAGLDAALLDCRLPDADGLVLCDAIHRAWPACVCVMMTAFRTANLEPEAHRFGARRVIDKPFDVDDVVRSVRDALIRR